MLYISSTVCNFAKALIEGPSARCRTVPGEKGVSHGRVHAKICLWLKCKRQSAGDLRDRVPKNTILEHNWSQKGPKLIQNDTQSDQNAAKRAPKSTKRVPKGNQMATKMHQKIDVRKWLPKGCSRGGRHQQFRYPFWEHFSLKMLITNRCKNRCRESIDNWWTIIQKWCQNCIKYR